LTPTADALRTGLPALPAVHAGVRFTPLLLTITLTLTSSDDPRRKQRAGNVIKGEAARMIAAVGAGAIALQVKPATIAAIIIIVKLFLRRLVIVVLRCLLVIIIVLVIITVAARLGSIPLLFFLCLPLPLFLRLLPATTVDIHN